MKGRALLTSLLCGAALAATALVPQTASAQVPYGVAQPDDWQRFYYYPYVYYPQNFVQFSGYDHLYYRYPREMQIPVYRKDWYNFYPTDKPYHWGHHFILDVF